MAGGPILPNSAIPRDTQGRTFPSIYMGSGGNAAPNDQGLGVSASIAGDVTWDLRFLMPPAAAIPSGTMKLRVLSLANAGSGDCKFQVNDAIVAVAASPSAASLTAESLSTATWAAGEGDKYKETKITLTPTPSGNDVLVVALTFKTSGYTLAVVSTHIVTVIWE